MRTIYGKDVGDTIDFRTQGPYTMRHPWPEGTAVSAGRGVVFGRGDTPNYSTLFMEIYPAEGGFLRGEGETPEACEDAVWAKYQRLLHCVPRNGSATQAHNFEPAGYTNGSGVCRHCRTWMSDVFTGEQLRQFCHECGVPTTYSARTAQDGTRLFSCEQHTITLARCTNIIERSDLTATPCNGALRFAADDLEAACDSCGARCGSDVADFLSAAFDPDWLEAHESND